MDNGDLGLRLRSDVVFRCDMNKLMVIAVFLFSSCHLIMAASDPAAQQLLITAVKRRRG